MFRFEKELMETYNDIWLAVLDCCKAESNITQVGFDTWLKPIKLSGFENNVVFLSFSSEVKKKIVKSQYGELIQNAFNSVLGFEVNIEYLYDPTMFVDASDEKKTEQPQIEEIHTNYQFTFDTFIEGPSNRFAYRAAMAVAEDPGGHIKQNNSFGNYNPLFIYGKSGLGKTHILNAICYEIRKNFPDMRILYVRAEDFANEFINALGKKTVDDFRSKFRNIDVLLIDDVQFIGGKERTEEEFFHTFNSLIENGKQIVLTSDRPPKEIQSLTERLCSRFENGLLADIQSPEFETRCAIIKNKAKLLNFKINDDVVAYIAEKIKTNIRQLEGTTKKLHAMSELSGHAPTIALAQKVIKDVIDDDIPPIPVTIEKILEEVSRTEGVSVDDIKSSKQKASVTHARKICMYIIREVTNLTYEQIGADFGKNYSTVIYNINDISKMIENDSKLERKVNDIINNVKTGS